MSRNHFYKHHFEFIDRVQVTVEASDGAGATVGLASGWMTKAQANTLAESVAAMITAFHEAEQAQARVTAADGRRVESHRGLPA